MDDSMEGIGEAIAAMEIQQVVDDPEPEGIDEAIAAMVMQPVVDDPVFRRLFDMQTGTLLWLFSMQTSVDMHTGAVISVNLVDIGAPVNIYLRVTGSEYDQTWFYWLESEPGHGIRAVWRVDALYMAVQRGGMQLVSTVSEQFGPQEFTGFVHAVIPEDPDPSHDDTSSDDTMSY